MKNKLKKCLAIMLILVTCFCTFDNNFIIGKFFASIIIPNSYAINPDDADDSQAVDTTEPGVDKGQLFNDKVIEIARKMAKDDYTSPDYPSKVRPPYAYRWGGDGELHGSSPAKGSNNVWYTVFDCRGFVAGSVRYAARELDMDDKLKNLYITWTPTEYAELTATGLYGCHKITSVSELKDGDILYRDGHTELFFRKDGAAWEVGAVGTPTCFNKAAKYGGVPGKKKPEDSITEYPYSNDWEAYFRYGTTSTYVPTGSIGSGAPDAESGQLGSGRWYSGEVDEKAELDEQVFDFQGNPQKMVYDGETNFSIWLFTLLSQLLDFIAGLLVSLLINPIMQLLNAIVNFLTNFINYISGLPMGT